MRYVIGIFMVIVAALFTFAAWAVDHRGDFEAACTQAGGVAVKSHYGPLVCIDREAVIEDVG